MICNSKMYNLVIPVTNLTAPVIQTITTSANNENELAGRLKRQHRVTSIDMLSTCWPVDGGS